LYTKEEVELLFFDPTRDGRARDAKGAGEAAETTAFLIGMQDLLAASLWIGMGSRILTALTSTCTAAIQLFAIGSMTIAHQSITLTVRTVKGDGDHRRLLFLGIDCSSKSTISCLFVPLPIILVKSSCHLPWTQPFWKTLDKQVKYFLAFLRAFDLLDADTPRRSWPRRVVLKQVIFMACLFRVAASTR